MYTIVRCILCNSYHFSLFRKYFCWWRNWEVKIRRRQEKEEGGRGRGQTNKPALRLRRFLFCCIYPPSSAESLPAAPRAKSCFLQWLYDHRLSPPNERNSLCVCVARRKAKSAVANSLRRPFCRKPHFKQRRRRRRR